MAQFDKYIFDEQREIAMWGDCIFIFDSSALLDFYYYPDATKQAIFTEIFEKIKGRLWIPSHVEFEFIKNRQSVIKKPISESYRPLIDDILKPLADSGNQIKKKVEELKQKTSKDNKHPYFDAADILQFEAVLDKYTEDFKLFDTSIRKKISEQEALIVQLEGNDTVKENIEKYFQVGDEYPFEKIMDIVNEGKIRYEFDIPPGYEDLKKEKKEGTQIFGDLIIWKQILEFAKGTDVNVVFVCNDLKKDWCILDERASEKRILHPRHELIKEFNDITGKTFWMYNQAQFLYKSNEILESAIAEEEIEEVKFVISAKSDIDLLVFKCHRCMETSKINTDDLGLDYDAVGGSERGMGAETQYVAEAPIQCNHCGEWIEGKFEIWEYPTGSINYTNITLSGAEIIDAPELYMELDDDGSDEYEE
jgi:hypothetical protein